MESAIGTIKTELVCRHSFQTPDQARLAIFDYIEAFYNPIRAHNALGYQSPTRSISTAFRITRRVGAWQSR
jgi:putative transposase